jgi:hypothetical protein
VDYISFSCHQWLAGKRAKCAVCGVKIVVPAPVTASARAEKPEPLGSAQLPPPITRTSTPPSESSIGVAAPPQWANYDAEPTRGASGDYRLAACPDCGKRMSVSVKACPNCGRSFPHRLTALLLAWTIGGIGAHKFYLGRRGEGLLYLFFCVTFIPALVALLDGFSYLLMTDAQFAQRHGLWIAPEPRATKPRAPKLLATTIVDIVRWLLGLSVLMTCMSSLSGAWVIAMLLAAIGLCLIPPSWDWIRSLPIVKRHRSKIDYTILTIVGAIFIVLPPFKLLDGREYAYGIPFAMLVGVCLLPAAWDLLARRYERIGGSLTYARWSAGIASFLLALYLAPDPSVANSRRDKAAPGLVDSRTIHEALITREEYGKAWPFTVDEGILAGKPGALLPEVTFTTGGKTYYVNGIAKQKGVYSDLAEIWADDPASGLKKSIGTITTRGVKLAEGIDEPSVARVDPEPAPIASGPVRCDQFVLRAAFNGEAAPNRRRVKVSLKTDLPDITEVTVTIDRGYFNVVDQEEYAEDYFLERSTVADWRTPRTVELDHSQWEAKLAKSRASFAAFGQKLVINGVNGFIEVTAIVPIQQSDPRFGVGNSNLVGSEVSARSRTVVGRTSLPWPVKTY